MASAERERLEEARTKAVSWRKWGPYLSERQWGTVREDYSENGDAWNYFTHDHSRSRAYRWGEDGLGGLGDDKQLLCFALSLWNERDPILKERLFGLTNGEGNHGEDVKEYYFYVDNLPTHSYQRWIYKYPQAAFPYDDLLRENAGRSRHELEYELMDTGVFAGSRYFDVEVEYAKADPEDLLIQLHVTNRGGETARLDLLPTIWFRNVWSWQSGTERPRAEVAPSNAACIALAEPQYGTRWLHCEGAPALLFTDNDTNTERLFGHPGPAYTKDAFHRYVIQRESAAVNPARIGTKAAAHYSLTVPAGRTVTVRLRLNATGPGRGSD